MSVYPEKLWLQRHEDCADHGCCELHEGTTWCVDKINETDVSYVRADTVDALRADAERWRHLRSLGYEDSVVFAECLKRMKFAAIEATTDAAIARRSHATGDKS